MKFKSFSDLQAQVAESDSLKQELVTNPEKFIASLRQSRSPLDHKGVFLTIVAIVGIVLMAAIILGSIIIFNSDDTNAAKVPEFLVSMGSTALGALVGLLAPTPNNN